MSPSYSSIISSNPPPPSFHAASGANEERGLPGYHEPWAAAIENPVNKVRNLCFFDAIILLSYTRHIITVPTPSLHAAPGDAIKERGCWDHVASGADNGYHSQRAVALLFLSIATNRRSRIG